MRVLRSGRQRKGRPGIVGDRRRRPDVTRRRIRSVARSSSNSSSNSSVRIISNSSSIVGEVGVARRPRHVRSSNNSRSSVGGRRLVSSRSISNNLNHVGNRSISSLVLGNSSSSSHSSNLSSLFSRSFRLNYRTG